MKSEGGAVLTDSARVRDRENFDLNHWLRCVRPCMSRSVRCGCTVPIYIAPNTRGRGEGVESDGARAVWGVACRVQLYDVWLLLCRLPSALCTLIY